MTVTPPEIDGQLVVGFSPLVIRGDDGSPGGAKGDKGDTGATPNLQMGTITTVPYGQAASASFNTTDPLNPLLNLVIPQGAPGSGATNVVQTVEPEQFTGTTDDQQFSAAVASIASTGGVIRLRPGKTYTWTTAPTTFDFSVYKKSITVIAFGAIINANYSGAAWTLQGNTGNAAPNTLIWLGGELNNSVGDGITLNDSGKAFFFRASAGCPNGSGWVAANVSGFSENHHWVECYDNNSTHSVSLLNLGSSSSSFARTVIRSMRIQGGVAGQAKINIGDNTALYGALIDGLSGNLTPGAIVMRVAGNLHGMIIQGNLHFEVSLNTLNTTGTWTTGSSFITCPAVTAAHAGWAVSGTGLSGFVGTVTPGVGFVLSSSAISNVPTNPTANGTGAALSLTPFAYYFTVGTISGGQRATMTAPINVNASMNLMYPGSSQSNLYGAVYAGWGLVSGDQTGDIAVGQCVNGTIANASPVALPATTETTVFTINVGPGEYILSSSLCINFTTASTASNAQMRITGGTATYSLSGQPTGQSGNAGTGNTNNQTVQLAVRGYLTVTAAGTVTITAQASSVANAVGTTPSSGWSKASGYTLQRVA